MWTRPNDNSQSFWQDSDWHTISLTVKHQSADELKKQLKTARGKFQTDVGKRLTRAWKMYIHTHTRARIALCWRTWRCASRKQPSESLKQTQMKYSDTHLTGKNNTLLKDSSYSSVLAFVWAADLIFSAVRMEIRLWSCTDSQSCLFPHNARSSPPNRI